MLILVKAAVHLTYEWMTEFFVNVNCQGGCLAQTGFVAFGVVVRKMLPHMVKLSIDIDYLPDALYSPPKVN